MDPPAGLQPAEAALFYTRGDANDPRLGEQTGRDAAAYAAAQLVLVGCPQDEGVRRNQGRPGAAQGPAEIRRALYRLGVNGLSRLPLFDAGDVIPAATLEETHATLQAAVQKILTDGKRVIVLGGGNDISYADCAALAQVAGDVLAFNVDAHFDVRADEVRNSGTPYRQLLEEGLVKPGRFYELGNQPFANSAVYAGYLREKGAHVMSLALWREKGIEKVLRRALREAHEAKAVFWGLDLDVVRAADAPGVSAPNPLGVSAEEFCLVATVAGREARSRVLEITELNPAFDLDGRTARLAAVAIWHFLKAVAEEQEK